jgi:hypothetical protein
VAGHQKLALRVIVPPNSTGTTIGVTAVGADGRRTGLGDVRLDGLPGTDRTTSYWAQEVRVPLRGAPGRIAALEFTPRTASGRAWLLDAWGWNPGTPDPQIRSLPRIDVGSMEAVEGDTGTRTYQVPVSVTGRGGGVVRLFLRDNVTYEERSWLATVRPGDRVVPVPVAVAGDTVFAEGEAHHLFAKSERGLVVGGWLGGLDVLNDDPEPVLTVEPVTARTAEGGTLTWRFSLSARSETPYYIITEPQPPATGTELSTTDVDPDWFFRYAYQDVQPSRPLSGTYLIPYAEIWPGETTGEITVPTVPDDLDEPDEVVELAPLNRTMPTLTGVVTD